MKRNLKGINGVIVHVPETYETTITAPGGTKFYVNNTIDDMTYVVRHGEVVTSSDPRIKPGDIAYFHHNMVKRRSVEYVDGKVGSSNELFDDMFIIPVEFVYLVKRGDDHIAVDPWCYVEPVLNDRVREGSFEIANPEKYKKQHGIMTYSNESLREQGIDDGTPVVFNLDSEYEFKIDGSVLYRMKTPWIIGELEDE